MEGFGSPSTMTASKKCHPLHFQEDPVDPASPIDNFPKSYALFRLGIEFGRLWSVRAGMGDS
jgi:hypothetical protein